MKLTAKTDFDAPAGFVYEALTDFTNWEREAVRRGIDVDRPAGTPPSGLGASWRVSGRYRGKQRRLLLKISKLIPGEEIEYAFDSPSANGTITLDIAALSARRSRLRLAIDIRPKTLAARLFLNTIRLAKGRVEGKLEARLEGLAAYVRQRHERSQAQV
jgi:uncharacterized protein YndB with AHSA1/START domain